MSTNVLNDTPNAVAGNGKVTLQDVLEMLHTVPWERVILPEPRICQTRFLSQVERASIKVISPSLANVVLRPSILGQAAARLAALQDRGVLEYLSGHFVATHLHYAFFSTHPRALRKARRGWSLLAAVDRANTGIQVWTSAEPLPDDPGQHFRRMRLHERLDELAQRKPVRAASLVGLGVE
jgi:hypothetical protein